MGVCIFAGLGVVVGGYGLVLAYIGKGKGGQVWMGQTDQAGLGNISSIYRTGS